jgi:hypothetical protein
MGVISMHMGAPSYTLSNDRVDLQVSIQGGHLTATFDLGRRKVCPYFIAPWWDERIRAEVDEVIRLLRGDFFCLPFGANADSVEGVHCPTHGEPANSCWDFVCLMEEGQCTDLRLSLDLSSLAGSVEKIIRLYKHEPVVYQENRIHGFSGRTTLGYHPTLLFPPGLGTGIVDLSEPLVGFVSPLPAGDPSAKGYSILKPGVEIQDRSAVPCMDGTTEDISRYPVRDGFVDIVLFASDPEAEFSYTTATFPDQGYLYFQIKDPRILSSTMFWMSNGGRYSEPWNGRAKGVLGMEEITGFFHYGLKSSLEPNMLQDRGLPTLVDIGPDRTIRAKLISGAIGIGPDFAGGVKSIVRKDEHSIGIISREDTEIEVPCRLDFFCT